MHWFLDPIQKKYADFEGRATRQEYWMFVLLYIIVGIALGLVAEILGIDSDLISGLMSIALLLPSLAIAARRLHDTGRSGWWQLLMVVPVVGWIILIVFLATPSDEGENRFGPSVQRAVNESTPAPIPQAERTESTDQQNQ